VSFAGSLGSGGSLGQTVHPSFGDEIDREHGFPVMHKKSRNINQSDARIFRILAKFAEFTF
jgi:hypothetical protein